MKQLKVKINTYSRPTMAIVRYQCLASVTLCGLAILAIVWHGLIGVAFVSCVHLMSNLPCLSLLWHISFVCFYSCGSGVEIYFICLPLLICEKCGEHVDCRIWEISLDNQYRKVISTHVYLFFVAYSCLFMVFNLNLFKENQETYNRFCK